MIDLCDEVLGTRAVRQHRFDWLLGDPNQHGRRIRLPVDAYYESMSLVVEYREKQHDEPVKIMDSRMTVSGVPRGEQRRRYDRLREELLPAHGLQLVVIKPVHLDCDARGRLRRRDRSSDAAKVATLLESEGVSFDN